MDLGANEWRTFLRVTLPAAAPGILSAALLVFTTSFDDYLITSFVAGVRSTTLPLQIYSMLKRGITPEINAVSTIILAATIPLVYIAQRLERGAMKLRTAFAGFAFVVLLMAAPIVARSWSAAANEPQLNIYCWSTYISPRVVRGFESKFHCHVNYDLYDSNEALLAKLQGGNVDYDLVIPSDYMVQILIQQHLLARLDKSHLPNVWANVSPRFLNLPFDPHNDYSVPYAWGTTGLAYRADWNSTDQVPDRAVASGLIPRFGFIDDTDGGRTARYSLVADYQRTSSNARTRATAYVSKYRLNLFSNFTYVLDDPDRGDQFEQADRRWVTGARVSQTRRTYEPSG